MRGENSTGANVVSCNRRDVSHFIAESSANKTGAIHKLSEILMGQKEEGRGGGRLNLCYTSQTRVERVKKVRDLT